MQSRTDKRQGDKLASVSLALPYHDASDHHPEKAFKLYITVPVRDLPFAFHINGSFEPTSDREGIKVRVHKQLLTKGLPWHRAF